jgi:hypothetical protein
MINPDITVEAIADDLARQIPMAADAYDQTDSQSEKDRLRGRIGVLLELLLVIDEDRGELRRLDWNARATSEKWTDDLDL